ncbi:MAG: hypothetical protein ACP5OR_08610 [Candidatus Dormibacteria bacterium]
MVGTHALGPTVPPRSMEDVHNAWLEELNVEVPKDIAAPEESLDLVGHGMGERSTTPLQARKNDSQIKLRG